MRGTTWKTEPLLIEKCAVSACFGDLLEQEPLNQQLFHPRQTASIGSHPLSASPNRYQSILARISHCSSETKQVSQERLFKRKPCYSGILHNTTVFTKMEKSLVTLLTETPQQATSERMELNGAFLSEESPIPLPKNEGTSETSVYLIVSSTNAQEREKKEQ
jgi:hypothetical protein